MKSLTEYINESSAHHTHSLALPESFLDTLKALCADWDRNFNAYWSLNFIYNIIGEACGKKAKVIKTAYDEKGKRNEREMHLFAINNAKGKQFRAEEDHNGQIVLYDNEKYLKTFGLGYSKEVDFGLGIIEALQKSDNFKLKEYKYSNAQLLKDLGLSVKKHPDIKFNIKMYYINDWKVLDGYVYKDGESASLRNDLRFDVVIPNSTEYKPLYRCDGAGMYGSDERYVGDDKDKFKSTVAEIVKNHLHIK